VEGETIHIQAEHLHSSAPKLESLHKLKFLAVTKPCMALNLPSAFCREDLCPEHSAQCSALPTG